MTRAFVSLSLCLTLVAAPARADQCDVRLTEGAARVESETQTFAPETGQGPRVTLVGDAAARPRSWQVRGRDQWYRFRHAIDFGLAGLAGTLAIVGPEQARPAVIGLVLILIYRGLTRWVRRAPATARGPFDEPSATPPETMLDTLIRVGREDAVTPVMVIVPRSEFIASAHALSVGGYAPIDHAVTETKLLTHRPGLSLGQSSNLATRRLLGKAASTSTAEVNERPAAEPIEAVASPLTDADTSPISSDRSSNGTDSPTHDFTAAAAVDGRESPAAVAIADGVVANRELITWRRRLDLGQKHERGLNSTSAAEVKSAGTIQPPLPPRQATRRSPLDLARPTLVLDQNQTRSNAGLRDAVAGPALVARSIDGEKKSERKLIPWRRPLNFGRKIDPDLDSTSAAEVDLAESENVEQRPRLLTRRLRLEFGRPALMFDQSRHSSGLAENIPQETEVGGIKVERKLITWRGPLTLGLKRNQEPGFTSAAEVKVSAEALAHRPPRLLNRRLPLNFGRPVIIDHLRHASAEAPYPTVATAVPAEMAAITKRKLLTWHRPLDFGLPPRSELASTSAAEVNSARTPADVQPKRLLTSRSRLDLGRPVRHPWNTAPAGSDATSSPTPTSPEPSPTVGPSQISTAFPKHSGRARGRLIEPLTSAAEVDSRNAIATHSMREPRPRAIELNKTPDHDVFTLPGPNVGEAPIQSRTLAKKTRLALTPARRRAAAAVGGLIGALVVVAPPAERAVVGPALGTETARAGDETARWPLTNFAPPPREPAPPDPFPPLYALSAPRVVPPPPVIEAPVTKPRVAKIKKVKKYGKVHHRVAKRGLKPKRRRR